VWFSSLEFLIGEAARNIRRNGLMSLAALATVAISMAVLGGSLLTIYRLHQFAEAQPKQFEMEVFLRVDKPRDVTMEVKRRIQALPGVERVTLFTREQAHGKFLEEDQQRGTGIGSEVAVEAFPDRLDISLSDPRRTKSVADAIRDATVFPEVAQVNAPENEIKILVGAQNVVRNVGGIVAILLILATALVIQNTIRLTVLARRREIRIMQLVGATPGFIRLPMVLEGIFYGAVGAIVAGSVVLYAASKISEFVSSKVLSPLTQNLPSPPAPEMVLLSLVVIGAVIGWLGSVLSIRRFLKRA
jgi:cell division transport system permease protein